MLEKDAAALIIWKEAYYALSCTGVHRGKNSQDKWFGIEMQFHICHLYLFETYIHISRDTNIMVHISDHCFRKITNHPSYHWIFIELTFVIIDKKKLGSWTWFEFSWLHTVEHSRLFCSINIEAQGILSFSPSNTAKSEYSIILREVSLSQIQNKTLFPWCLYIAPLRNFYILHWKMVSLI